MRWILAALGVIGLAGGVYFGLEPRLRRPTLRVALNLRPSDPDDAALAAGVALALEERNERAGRYRVKTAHQTVQANGSIDVPRPGAHTMLHGLEPLDATTDGVDGPALPVDARQEAVALLSWMRERNLTRLTQPIWWRPPVVTPGRAIPTRPPTELELAASSFNVLTFAFVPKSRDPAGASAAILATRPQVVHIQAASIYFCQALQRQLRADGFEGPFFLSSESVWRSLWSLDEFLIVRAPLTRPPPADFLARQAHPFAYAGYTGTLRYLDALDANPTEDFTAPGVFPRWSGFDDLKGEARVYEVKSGRFHPVPPK